MLLQTNSYIVPKDKRSEHARLLRRFRQTLQRLGCDHFEVYEQVGSNWAGGESTGRFVQIMRFRDRKHQQQVQAAEKDDKAAQQFIGEFCALINFPYQQQQGLFAVGYYTSAVPVISPRKATVPPGEFVGQAEAEDGVRPGGRDGGGGTATGELPLTDATDAARRMTALAQDQSDPVAPLPLDLPVSRSAAAPDDASLAFAALDLEAPAQTSLALEGGPEHGDASPIADDPETRLELVPDIDDFEEQAGEEGDGALPELVSDDFDAIETPPRGDDATRPRAR